ncbi:MAG TPA: Fur family transcriptional regulator [Chloroflexota bacterium]|nr:Fur family transcriptional regulator [Chloroflexota bacterium]
MESLADLLHARGSRVTPQRQLVIEQVLATRGHIVPEAIYAKVSRQFPSINRSTVYRTLQLLEEMGLIQHAHVEEGATRYHRAEEPAHLHLVCHGCHAVQEVADLSLGEPLRQALLERFGFDCDLTHLAIAGRCRACRAAQPPHTP